MSKIPILLLAIFPFLLPPKETKKVIRERPLPAFSETFFVLRSDTSIRHGNYKAEAFGKVLLSGFYKMGEPDSIWIQYNKQGKIRARGWFKGNNRDSIWEYFNDKGELEQKLDFTHNQVLYYQTIFAKHPFRVISKTDTVMSILDRPPLFIGGMSRLNDCVNNELRIPLHKPEQNVQGTVYVAVTIDSLGKTSRQRIIKGIGKACNEEALRVMRSIPDDWIPGVLNDQFVTVDYIILFQFDPKLPGIDVSDLSNKNINPQGGVWELVY
ncbi:MAG: energy transducer TonB [Prolixibacteraceae bacterium]|jgi:protein TonB|nr:energy transducer TonB [Prolixibacteraceae bacterium]